MAWPVVVFYSALRLGCATAALVFFFRVRALGGRAGGAGAGGVGAGGGRSAMMRSAVSHTHYSTLAGSSIFTDANRSVVHFFVCNMIYFCFCSLLFQFQCVAPSSPSESPNSSLDGVEGGGALSSEGNSSLNGPQQVGPLSAVRGAEIIFLAGMEQGGAGGR